MLHSNNVVALRAAPPTFVDLYVAPYWQRATHAAAIAVEVWREARALQRKMMPRRLADG